MHAEDGRDDAENIYGHVVNAQWTDLRYMTAVDTLQDASATPARSTSTLKRFSTVTTDVRRRKLMSVQNNLRAEDQQEVANGQCLGPRRRWHSGTAAPWMTQTHMRF